jgi:hypothetical protein
MKISTDVNVVAENISMVNGFIFVKNVINKLNLGNYLDYLFLIYAKIAIKKLLGCRLRKEKSVCFAINHIFNAVVKEDKQLLKEMEE